MLSSKSFLSFSVLILFFLSVPVCALGPLADSKEPAEPQPQVGYDEFSLPRDTEPWRKAPEKLFSPSVGQLFHEIAYELANSEDVTDLQTKQAVTFLNATMNLDSRAKYVLADMIKLLCRNSKQDYSQLLYQLLVDYVDESADLDVAQDAVRCLLESLNSREQREKLLEQMLKALNGKNSVLEAELSTLLGLLMAEKADSETAMYHFMRAFNKNKYDKTAFAKLTELMGEDIEPATYFEHLRLRLRENPLDMEAALAVARYAEKLQLYEIAAGTYEYCAQLFGFLYPSEALPSFIYLPWAISSYNTQRSGHKCSYIAEQVRQTGRFDLLLEAIAGKAEERIGNIERANRIFQLAEAKAIQLFETAAEPSDEKNQSPQSQAIAAQLAWFYCFASADADKALQWANKAYSIEPGPTTAAFLAYALVMNDQTEWAGAIIENYEKNQVAELALAQIQLQDGRQSEAFETLKSVIASDPGSLEAHSASRLLEEYGGDYIPPISSEITLMALRSTFGNSIVPVFVGPDQMLSVQLNLRGSKFFYGNEFGGIAAIKNTSPEPLAISDDGLFKGNLRVNARISGDLTEEIPNLISVRVRPASPIDPGESFFVPIHLRTGKLRQILRTHPQASLDMEFTVFVDPVITRQGKLTNRLADIEPAKVTVKRPGIKLTGRYLQNRFNSLARGRQGQKINTAQLFTGLLIEQQTAGREPLYKYKYADWMPDLLKSALLHNLADDDWVVKVHTMAAMLDLSLDYELISAVSEGLDDTNWPVRMMAIYLLANSQQDKFAKVLDWTTKYDSNILVRDMAVALGAAELQPQIPPAEPAEENPQNKTATYLLF